MEKLNIVVATTNKGKLEEIQVQLKSLSIQLLSLKDIGFNEKIIEDKDTFEENAVLKALTVANKLNKVVLADDSGLEVDALAGRPGVYSARFAGENANDRENNLKLLNELKEIPLEKRNARFRCVLALAVPNKVIGTVEGSCSGLIGFEEKGAHGFGYDPLFLIPEYNQTFAELGAAVKNKISHRAKALIELKTLLQKNLSQISLFV